MFNYLKQRNLMVEKQLISRDIRDKRVIEAMGKIPRENFVGPEHREQAYVDEPLPIGNGQTISQPYIVALMTQLLQLKGKEKVLEIGTGSGYQTAVLAELAGQVYSVESIPQFYYQAKHLLAGYKNIWLLNGNGYYGWKQHAPYDRIIVTAAPKNIPPPLVSQLKDDGIMVIPAGSPFSQSLYVITKKGGKIHQKAVSPVAFVPLRDEV